MQALMLRALHRTPKLFKGAPISFSQHFSPCHHNHISSSAKQQPQREMDNQVVFSGKEDIRQGYREDMAESYGVAYATRCSDEGYGERYGEGVGESLDKEDMKMPFGLAHATWYFGEGYKESHGESITLGNQHVGNDDMTKSFGLAYATRSFDEGFGDRYKESIEVVGKTREGIKVLGNQSLEENEHVGSDDVIKSFGLAYVTRCLDEGYGDRYEESVEVVGNTGEGIKVLGQQNLEEKEHVGSEDREESFGLAYVKRCFDEGYGDRYEESVEVVGNTGEGIEVLGQQKLEEKEHVASEDMEESFGLAYATRCFDEGYGDRYGESSKVVGNCGEDIKMLGNQNFEEKDLAKSLELAFSRVCFDQKVDEEDMMESFGLAYATRCSDEGYGERYEESIKVLHH